MKKDVEIYNQKLARKAQNYGVFKLCDLNSIPIGSSNKFTKNLVKMLCQNC
jgi:hypothetical protein